MQIPINVLVNDIVAHGQCFAIKNYNITTSSLVDSVGDSYNLPNVYLKQQHVLLSSNFISTLKNWT